MTGLCPHSWPWFLLGVELWTASPSPECILTGSFHLGLHSGRAAQNGWKDLLPRGPNPETISGGPDLSLIPHIGVVKPNLTMKATVLASLDADHWS